MYIPFSGAARTDVIKTERRNEASILLCMHCMMKTLIADYSNENRMKQIEMFVRNIIKIYNINP